jgi:integrase
MARTVHHHRLAKRAERARLQPAREPYWALIAEGQHLGYYKGDRGGRWVARYRPPGRAGGYQKRTLGAADDTADANGQTVFDWKQAQDAARAWFALLDANGGRVAGPYLVADALDDYLAGFRGKSVEKTRYRVESAIRPTLGGLDCDKLTAVKLRNWLEGRAASPARLRSSALSSRKNERAADTPEAKRARRATANRDWAVLRAALNAAYRAGRIASDDAWRRVKPFQKADGARLRYLSDDEARRLVNACDPAFRPLVQAALLTGARYQELAAARVQDFDAGAAVLLLTDTKAGKARPCYLEADGAALMTSAALGRRAFDLLFPRPDGGRWGPSQQARFMARASEAARLEPAATFHDLRRSYGARLARAGVPMAVIAEALGHADERVTRRHYAHLAPAYVGETIRRHAAGLGIVEPAGVTRLRRQ